MVKQISLHAAGNAEGSADGGEYGDEHLQDSFPNFLFHFLFPFSYSFNFSLLAPGTFARIYHFDSFFVFTSISTAATIITP